MNRSASARTAFTLVELLVVVVLLALVATTLGVRLAGAADGPRLRGATVTLEQTLRLAQQRARRRHAPVWMEFDPGAGRYRIADADGHGAWQVLEGVTLGRCGLRGAATPATERGGRVWITPTGASLPWALELRAGRARRVLFSDGVTGRLRHQDGVELATCRWPEALP